MGVTSVMPKLLVQHQETLASELITYCHERELTQYFSLDEHQWKELVEKINSFFCQFIADREVTSSPAILLEMETRIVSIFDAYTHQKLCHESFFKILKRYRQVCTQLLNEHQNLLQGYLHHAFEATHHFFDHFEIHCFDYLKSLSAESLSIHNVEKCYAKLLDTAKEGIMITDHDNCIIDVNASFLAITGYQRDDVIGKNPRFLKSAQHDPLFYQQMWHALLYEGTWSGEIFNKKKDGEVYLEHLDISVLKDATGRIENFIGRFSDQNAVDATKRELAYLSRFDALTGLPNQQLFKVRLERAIARCKRNKHHFSVLFIDIDNFNVINNTYGHSYGDRILKELSFRLKPLLRINDTISRYGGDEFMVLLEDFATSQSIETIGRKLLDAISRPIMMDDKEFILTASLGIAVYPYDGENSEQLVKNAHLATYQAKQNGKNLLMFYNRTMTQDVEQKMILTRDLHYALENGEFELYYQPLVNLVTHQVESVEALIRWNHPKQGLIPPDQFIPLAEETHHIIAIGKWVLWEACHQLKSWDELGVFDGGISVNISGIQLAKSGFEQVVEEVLWDTKIDPTKLELEITETQVMDHLDQAVATLQRIQKLGVRISIDDFGTGYSSLSHLRALPIDKLKIDRQFVKEIHRSMGDQEISKAIIAMAKALNLHVLAEGIEEQSQLFYLLSQGCEMGQGYHFSKPLKNEAFLEWLANK